MRDKYGNIEPPVAIFYPEYPNVTVEELDNGIAVSARQQIGTRITDHITAEVVRTMQKIANNTSTIFIEINETVIKEMIDLYYEKERQPNYEQMWKELKKELDEVIGGCAEVFSNTPYKAVLRTMESKEKGEIK